MPVFDEELHGDLCFGSFCPHYTVLNKLLAARARALYERCSFQLLDARIARSHTCLYIDDTVGLLGYSVLCALLDTVLMISM